MAEKTLKTRIQLKYDTYSNWTSNDPVLKAGEVAIATIESGNTQEVNSVTAPQVVIKVGDGTSKYSELPFTSAKAGDVYSWAKASTKPSYTASEISGLSDYIAGEIEDTDTTYRIVEDSEAVYGSSYTFILESKAKGSTSWEYVSHFTVPTYDDSGIKSDISEKADKSTTLAGYGITNAYTKTEADATFTTPEEVETIAADKINTLIDGANSEDTITNIQTLVDYVNNNGADVAALAKQILEAKSTAGAASTTANETKARVDDLAAVATTGNVNDLVQTSGDVLILDCGTSAV